MGISDILNDKLDLRHKKKDAVLNILETEGYDVVDDDNEYKYLIRLPMDSVTQENVERIIKEKKEKIQALETLRSTSEIMMWNNELEQLDEQLTKARTSKKKMRVKNK